MNSNKANTDCIFQAGRRLAIEHGMWYNVRESSETGICRISDFAGSCGFGWIRKREHMRQILRRAGRLLTAFLALAVLAIAVVNGYVWIRTRKRILMSAEDTEQPYDYILVLGCAVHGDGTPSPMLKDRVEKGIELYQAGMSERLLMSGDHANDSYNEVQVMKNIAVGAGVPEEAVVLDHAGFSTYESVARAKNVFGAKRILIVTQEYHLYRALYIAQEIGLDADGACADGQDYAGQWMRNLREAAARVKDFLVLFSEK